MPIAPPQAVVLPKTGTGFRFDALAQAADCATRFLRSGRR